MFTLRPLTKKVIVTHQLPAWFTENRRNLAGTPHLSQAGIQGIRSKVSTGNPPLVWSWPLLKYRLELVFKAMAGKVVKPFWVSQGSLGKVKAGFFGGEQGFPRGLPWGGEYPRGKRPFVWFYPGAPWGNGESARGKLGGEAPVLLGEKHGGKYGPPPIGGR